MSNNKQSMNLYTEEQLKKAIAIGFDWCHQKHIPSDDMIDTFIKQLTPIELPSDSLCINCDESKSTHNVCMDCMIKIGKENIELPSDEEIKKYTPYPLGKGFYNPLYSNKWEEGAKWMRNKIQGGDK